MSTSEDTTPRPGLSYRDAGVDIDAGNDLVQRIAPLAKATHRPGVLSALGGFGALFELPVERYRQPVLVAGTDGVGTKLALAVRLGQHDTIGVDLVAMCANDIVVTGAEPLFFLDYYATGKLEVEVASRVVAGIAEGCRLAGAALVGGETAEMPGMYQGSDYDLAGFCVGIVERDAIIDGSRVDSGDVLIGLASSGPHSNGYSLIRNILDHMAVDPGAAFEDSTLGEVLMTPTRIYVKSVLGLATQVSLKAVCHITGGGILENLPRVLPAERCARVNLTAWTRPAIFDWLQEQGEIDEKEMLRTFNCGIGMVLCVAERDVDTALSSLRRFGETPYPIGTVVHSSGPASVAFV